MKNLAILLICLPCLVFASNNENIWKKNFEYGDPGIESINAMAFGPEGILFIGDSKTASVYAIDTKDDTQNNEVEPVSLENVDVLIASVMGQSIDDISIQDMAVNPASKTVYFAVHALDGQPVLLKLKDGKLHHLPIRGVNYSKIELKKVVESDAKDRRGRSLRRWTVSDLAYHKGKVMVSGLSNEEFSSTFRSISFPFDELQSSASLEIYHAAHGQFETYSPIKAFMPLELNGQDHLVASYTCTPMVIFPINELKDGKHVKGRTVAELGNRNTPLDIINIERNGKTFILMSNTSRALMKIDPGKIENYKDFLTTPVEESSATAGVEFIALPYVNVQQMDRFDESRVVMLQRMSNGELNLNTVDNRRL